MNPGLETCCRAINRDGFTLIRSVFARGACDQLIHELDRRLKQDECHAAIRTSQGTVFAARNILSLMPQLIDWWRNERLIELLQSVLGMQAGLVRGLYFDKPADRSWSLPFHKDMTIAVKNNRLPTERFCKPTSKAGVPHVEAPREVLDQMLTLRIHLDDVSSDNGPLQVIPRSHRSGKATAKFRGQPSCVTCKAGDVLAMRPLVSHASGHTRAGSKLHRRILHLEFSGTPHLPDEFEWHTFVALQSSHQELDPLRN